MSQPELAALHCEQIRVEVADGIATITLNRPERLNAYTSQMRQEIAAAFAACDADDNIRVVIVTGAGRGFCAGADMAASADAFDRSNEEGYLERIAAERARSTRPWEMTKPIIAAINGAAVGVGITMTLQWDIRIAAESAKIAFAFVRRGVMPEALSTWILPRLIGVSRAAELLYSGRTLSAREAAEYGVVSRVVPDAALLPTVRALALDIAQNAAPVSVALTKRMIWSNLTEPDMARAEVIEQQLFTWTGTQPDAREGVRAFLEKRVPRWSMKPSSDLPAFTPRRRRPS
ncbi:MAG: enoyl-CoA hydratase/isomerase family protein [Deltaproteobacteria bacterium]|nr:enoyl-CoA hydratase/isomerase family protein [Deltaproteobacteria bacterium]